MARIRLDFFADQSIAWCQTPGGEAALLRTLQPLGPSRGCAGEAVRAIMAKHTLGLRSYSPTDPAKRTRLLSVKF